MLPESYKTSLVWTINLRSLKNFLKLRTSPAALPEIRELAWAIVDQLPKEHLYLVEEDLI
jgi:thymidylate synthase (FAD)